MYSYITHLRENLRNYLSQEINSNRMTLARGQALASEINIYITHNITDNNILSQKIKSLVGLYPELKDAFSEAITLSNLDEKRRIVDDEVLKLIDQNQLDQAHTLLLSLKK